MSSTKNVVSKDLSVDFHHFIWFSNDNFRTLDCIKYTRLSSSMSRHSEIKPPVPATHLRVLSINIWEIPVLSVLFSSVSTEVRYQDMSNKQDELGFFSLTSSIIVGWVDICGFYIIISIVFMDSKFRFSPIWGSSWYQGGPNDPSSVVHRNYNFQIEEEVSRE